MRAQLFRKFTGLKTVLFLTIMFSNAIDAEGTSLYLKPWKDVYQELYPGEKPQWRSLDDVREWAVKEQERLEPLVLEVLRGERSDKSWSAMLFVARVIPTQAIRDVLVERVRDIVQKQDGKPLKRMSGDASVLAVAIDVFAKAGDVRAVPMALDVLGIENQAYEVVEHCVEALRKLGDHESIPALRAIKLRERDVHIDRLCGLAERVIEARSRGESICTDAPQQLRMLLKKYLRAIEDEDYQAYAAVMPFGFKERDDEAEVRNEIFKNEEVREVIEELKDSLDHPFEINEDELRAKLLFAGRYKLECALEVDGWKIAGILRVAP